MKQFLNFDEERTGLLKEIFLNPIKYYTTTTLMGLFLTIVSFFKIYSVYDVNQLISNKIIIILLDHYPIFFILLPICMILDFFELPVGIKILSVIAIFFVTAYLFSATILYLNYNTIIGTTVLLLLIFAQCHVFVRRKGKEEYVFSFLLFYLKVFFFGAVVFSLIVIVYMTAYFLFDMQSYLLLYYILCVTFYIINYIASWRLPVYSGVNKIGIEISKTEVNLLLYIVFPFIFIYILVFYVYFFLKFLFKGNLHPANFIVWFSTFVAFSSIFLRMLTKDKKEVKSTELEKREQVSFVLILALILMIPIMIFLFYAIMLRINTYGLTEYRYYLLVISIVNTFLFVYTLFTKHIAKVFTAISDFVVSYYYKIRGFDDKYNEIINNKKKHQKGKYNLAHILTVMIIAVFISVLSPFRATKLSEASQKERLNMLIEKNNEDDYEDIRKVHTYLQNHARSEKELEELSTFYQKYPQIFDVEEEILEDENNIVKISNTLNSFDLSKSKVLVQVKYMPNSSSETHITTDEGVYVIKLHSVEKKTVGVSNSASVFIEITKDNELVFEKNINEISREIYNLLRPGTDVKKEESKTEETKTEEVKIEATKTEETKTEVPKTEETKTEEAKTEEAKTEEAKTEEAKTEATKAEEAKKEDSKKEEEGKTVSKLQKDEKDSSQLYIVEENGKSYKFFINSLRMYEEKIEVEKTGVEKTDVEKTGDSEMELFIDIADFYLIF